MHPFSSTVGSGKALCRPCPGKQLPGTPPPPSLSLAGLLAPLGLPPPKAGAKSWAANGYLRQPWPALPLPQEGTKSRLQRREEKTTPASPPSAIPAAAQFQKALLRPATGAGGGGDGNNVGPLKRRGIDASSKAPQEPPPALHCMPTSALARGAAFQAPASSPARPRQKAHRKGGRIGSVQRKPPSLAPPSPTPVKQPSGGPARRTTSASPPGTAQPLPQTPPRGRPIGSPPPAGGEVAPSVAGGLSRARPLKCCGPLSPPHLAACLPGRRRRAAPPAAPGNSDETPGAPSSAQPLTSVASRSSRPAGRPS